MGLTASVPDAGITPARSAGTSAHASRIAAGSNVDHLFFIRLLGTGSRRSHVRGGLIRPADTRFRGGHGRSAAARDEVKYRCDNALCQVQPENAACRPATERRLARRKTGLPAIQPRRRGAMLVCDWVVPCRTTEWRRPDQLRTAPPRF